MWIFGSRRKGREEIAALDKYTDALVQHGQGSPEERTAAREMRTQFGKRGYQLVSGVRFVQDLYREFDKTTSKQ